MTRQRHLTAGTIITRTINEQRSGTEKAILAVNSEVATVKARRDIVTFGAFEQPAAAVNLVLAATTWTDFLSLEVQPDPNNRSPFAVTGSAWITIPAGGYVAFRLVAGATAFADNQYPYNNCAWLWSDTIFHLPPAGKRITYKVQVYATAGLTITYRNRGILAMRGWY